MADRSSTARAAAQAVSLVVDVVLFTPRGRELAVLFVPDATARPRSRDRLALPSDLLAPDEALTDAAARIARRALGDAPALLEQVGALGANRRSAEGCDIAVTYFGVTADGGASDGAAWIPLSELGPIARRQREELDWALATMRARMDQQPIAFRLLPPTFTLSELQAVYELLLGHRLHKASFRRSLHAAALVEATDEWRSEGRGRPAQLFRYAPPRRRRAQRGVRFDLLG
jgi:8-oxo-dGTP diphosphatase